MNEEAPEHRCTATSKARGERCKRPAIPGGTVCRYHGGAAPQVIRSAKQRLAELVDPAIRTLAKAMKKSKPDNVALRAAIDVLDRNGYKPPDRHVLTGEDGGPIDLDLNVDASELLIGKILELATGSGSVSDKPPDEGGMPGAGS